MPTNQIANAIRKRLRLKIDYDPGTRLIEPHAVGYTRQGNVVLRAFQTEGASASGEPKDWKFLRVDRIRSLSTTDESFTGPRPGYKRGDSHMKGGIIEEL